jgi:hypothetical protein
MSPRFSGASGPGLASTNHADLIGETLPCHKSLYPGLMQTFCRERRNSCYRIGLSKQAGPWSFLR